MTATWQGLLFSDAEPCVPKHRLDTGDPDGDHIPSGHKRQVRATGERAIRRQTVAGRTAFITVFPARDELIDSSFVSTTPHRDPESAVGASLGCCAMPISWSAPGAGPVRHLAIPILHELLFWEIRFIRRPESFRLIPRSRRSKADCPHRALSLLASSALHAVIPLQGFIGICSLVDSSQKLCFTQRLQRLGIATQLSSYPHGM